MIILGNELKSAQLISIDGKAYIRIELDTSQYWSRLDIQDNSSELEYKYLKERK